MIQTIADAEHALVDCGHRVFVAEMMPAFTALILEQGPFDELNGISVRNTHTFDVCEADGRWMVAQRRHGGFPVGEPRYFTTLEEVVRWLLGRS